MIALLYPLKMDKNLSEAYSKIYEMRTSLDDYGTPEKRQAAKDQVEINKKVNKYGGKTPSGTSAVDAKKGLDDTINSSHEPEGTMVEGQKYGLTKGTGKASGAYKKYLENAKKMQEADKKKKKTGNPAFDDPSHHSFRKSQYNSHELQGEVVSEMKKTKSNPKNLKDMSKGAEQKAPVDYRTLAQSHVPVGNIFNEKKMDPVGQEDGDINNDGKKDGTDKYLMKRRKAIGKAIAKKRGKVKEGFSAWRIDLDFNEQVKK